MLHKEQRIILPPSGVLTIFVFGDLQYGAEGFLKEAWEEFEHEYKTTPEPKTCIGLGDYGDSFRPTIMKALDSVFAKDNDAKREQDHIFIDSQDKFLDTMEFLKGKIMGLHEGHHKYTMADGSSSTQRMCTALKTTFLGWMASTRIVLVPSSRQRQGSRSAGYAYTIISMHGTGSAQCAATDFRWLETRIVPAFVADGFLRGHSCKSGAWTPFERAIVRRKGVPGLDRVPVKCMNVGGFSRGYTDGWRSSYVEEKGLTPQAQGYGIIRLKLGKLPSTMSSKYSGLQSEYVNRLYQPPTVNY